MQLPTERAVKEYLQRYKHAKSYHRQFMFNPFKLSRAYYKHFKNQKTGAYICKNFIKGMCWHHKCTRMHDVALSFEPERARNVFGEALINGMLHYNQTTMILTVQALDNRHTDYILANAHGPVDIEECEEAEEPEGNPGKNLLEGVLNQLFEDFVIRGVVGARFYKQLTKAKFQALVQFATQQQLQVAVEALNHKNINLNGTVYKLFTKYSQADLF